MIEIRKRWSDFEREPSPAGETVKILYHKVVDPDGSERPEAYDKVDLALMMNEAARGCTVYDIINRYNNGDLNAIDSAAGFYGDFTVFGDLRSSLQAHIDLKNRFASSDRRLREMFGNDVNKFIVDVMSSATPGDRLKDIADEFVAKVKADHFARMESVKPAAKAPSVEESKE